MAAEYAQMYAFLKAHYKPVRFEGRGKDVAKRLTLAAMEEMQRYGYFTISRHEARDGEGGFFDENFQPLQGLELYAKTKAALGYAREWWRQTAALLIERGWWPETPNAFTLVKGGWVVDGHAAIANMRAAVREELADPDADDTLPLGEVLALAPLADEDGYLVEVEVPNTPEAAADLIDQAVSRLGLGPGIVDEEFVRTARLDHMGYS